MLHKGGHDLGRKEKRGGKEGRKNFCTHNSIIIMQLVLVPLPVRLEKFNAPSLVVSEKWKRNTRTNSRWDKTCQ